MRNRKIKILQTIRQGKIGGGESHVIDLVSHLDRSRFESVVLSFTDGPMVEKMRELGIKTHVIYTERPFDFRKWKEVRGILKEEKVDIVHAHGTRANSNTYYSASLEQIPLLYTVHGWSFHQDQPFLLKKLRIWGEQYLVNKAALTVCVSQNNYDDAAALFGMKRATIVKYGIDLDRFDPEKTLDNFRPGLPVRPDTILVGFVVRMTIQKDPLTLVRAISLLPDYPNVKFVFIGDGDLKEHAIRLARELNVHERIIFMGFRQDIPEVLKGLDIYCLPSLWEGLPIGMLEAMGMAKPVITTTVDGAKEVIRNGENGLLVPVRSPRRLSEALSELIADASLREKLGENARRTVIESFNVKQMTKKIENLYETLDRKRSERN